MSRTVYKRDKSLILIVDDEEMIRNTLTDILEDENYAVITAQNAQEAQQEFNNNPDLILLDIWMPDIDGITLLKQWNEFRDLPPVIMMSGHGNIETAVESTKLGAYYFLEKPLSTAKLLLTIQRALETHDLQLANNELNAKINPKVALIGNSTYIKEIEKKALELAESNLPILLVGKSGTGKQHLAKFIHQYSKYKDDEFCIFSCISNVNNQAENLAEIIIRNPNATIYIDHLSHMDSICQELMRQILKQNIFIFAGKKYDCSLNRFIFATADNLVSLRDNLLPELFDCLNVAKFELLPLSEHASDVTDLLEYFCKYFADYEKLNYRHFDIAAQNYLRNYEWKGNILELRNLVQRLLIENKIDEISLDEAKSAIISDEYVVDEQLSSTFWTQIINKNLSLREAREEFERQYLLEQLKLCAGNIAKLSERVAMDRTNLYRKLKNLNIDPKN